MSIYPNSVQVQINLIEQAMKDADVWSYQTPEWIHSFTGGQVPDIWQWLQYIHLPLRQKGDIHINDYLAPQLASFIDGDASHQQILKLIIELDALSPTLETNKKP